MASRSHARQTQSNVNLWRIPLGLSLASIALFGLTMIPDTLDALGYVRLPTWFTMGGIDDARAILSAMLGCISTVLALIFSVALLVLSMVATLFGPRLLYRFLADWVTQFTIGLFMATFVFLCLVFLVTHQDEHSRFVPQTALIVGWVLVLVSFGFLVFYSHRIATSIQNPDLVARIVDDIRHEMAPPCGQGTPPSTEVVEQHLAEGAPVVCEESGYVQEIDHLGLVADASSADAVVHLLFRPGQFVLRGEQLGSVWPEDKASQIKMKGRVRLGRHRTLSQDGEFGIAQIVEIALRALSPAVNDTFTGVACVDWIGDALLVCAEAPDGQAVWYDEKGKARLRVRPVRLERLIRLSFDQIRQAGADNPAVLIRMLDIIRRTLPRVSDDAARKALVEEAQAIWEAAQAKVAIELDRRDVEAAWRKVTAS